MLDIVPLGNIKVALDERTSVNFDLSTLTDNFCGINNVFQDGLMNRGESPTSWTLLFRIALALSTGLRQDSPESDNKDLRTSQLLLQLPNDTIVKMVIGAQLRNRNINNNGLFMAN